MYGTTLRVIAVSMMVISFSFFAMAKDAQGSSAPNTGAPGCGVDSAKFAVDNGAGGAAASGEPGKALVYFIEDDSNFGSFPKPTTRMGVDGKWVGATHGNSYMALAVDPGEHHLCASWQTAVILGKGKMASAAHFTAEAGGVYYFEVKNTFILGDNSAITDMSLKPLDSDEGQLLANKYPVSVSKPKK
jgi:hypothetical protein